MRGLFKRLHPCVSLALGATIAVQIFTFHIMAPARADERPRLSTHESLVDELLATTELPLGDPRAMFGFVLANLGDRVKVYPTENYYYFRFVYRGVGYSGNIRLAASDRDQGKVHFAYFEDFRGWKSRPAITHVVLDRSSDVAVERLRPLQYRVSLGQKSVIFELNDLSGVVPPPSLLTRDEKYIGPIFDESAVRFFLVYNGKLKHFHYLLDETAPVADEFAPAGFSDRILIGKRTGFAFYRDRVTDRKILIGVFETNVRDNNYFDGPFDQLPDNFIDGDTLRQSIVDSDPKTAGKIDRFGNYLDGTGRYLITPYLRYSRTEELLAFHVCATKNRKIDDGYDACLATRHTVGKTMSQPAPRRQR